MIIIKRVIKMNTFSVNTDVYAKMPKVTKLNLTTQKQIEQEWLSEAYLKIVEGKSSENISLSAYSAACERNSQLARVRTAEVPLLNDNETQLGYYGVPEEQIKCTENLFETVENTADIDYFVTSFLDMRDYVYLEEGKDLWWLLELSRWGIKKAQKKLRELFDTYDYLKELIEFVLKTPCCYAKLKVILGEKHKMVKNAPKTNLG